MTTPQIDLNTSLKQYEAAWAALNKVRSTASKVTLDKATLRALLHDHGNMASKLGVADQ